MEKYWLRPIASRRRNNVNRESRYEPKRASADKPRKHKMKKGWKIALIVLAVLLALVLIAVGVVYAKFHSVHRAIYDDGRLTAEEEKQVEQLVEGMENDPDVQEQQKEMEEALELLLQEQEGQQTPAEVHTPAVPDLEIRHDDNIVNILLIGTDERTDGFSSFARGDSCMILSLNKSTGRAKLVSLERGMGVPILSGQYQGQWDWLTHTFCYGGADLMMREVRECFRVDVNRYIRVNFTSFRQGIDTIGGVDITLTQAEADYLNSVGSQVTFSAGPSHLYGWAALQYARCRKIDSDWMRIKRQRTVIQAAINKTRSLGVGELNDLLNILSRQVKTNLTESEILELMSLAPRFQGVTLEQMTIPASGTYGGMRGMGGRSLYAVDFAANAKILQDFLYG